MVDERDGDKLFCLVDAVDGAKVAAARGVQTGRFEVHCTAQPWWAVRQASVDELDEAVATFSGSLERSRVAEGAHSTR